MAASTIDDNHDHIRYDTACKQLLSDRHILAWIIKDHVSECQEMMIEEIIRCIEDDPETSKRAVFPEAMTTYDLLFTMTVPSKTKPVLLSESGS